MWSELTETEQTKECCASDECYGRPRHRFEHGGVGSVYCSECRAAIEAYRVAALKADMPGVNYEAWARTLIGFIRAKGLEDECKDWCGGWPCPITRPYVQGTVEGFAKRALKRVT